MKRHAPAASRNALPIAEVLAVELPASGLVLELASGSGEHAVVFARRFAQLEWQPTDADPQALQSIGAWAEEAGIGNLRAPLQLDASADEWPIAKAAAVLCINMVHISAWAATEGLFAGAARVLDGGAPLILYGPYREADVPTAPSNEAFDKSLRGRNPEWGLRQVGDVDRLAVRTGFTRTARHPMPANNVVLVYRKN